MSTRKLKRTVRVGAVVYLDGQAHHPGAVLNLTAAEADALADCLVSDQDTEQGTRDQVVPMAPTYGG